ncbi:MAG: hypothetical protein AAF747_08555 [Planctomycetota bacterium]
MVNKLDPKTTISVSVLIGVLAVVLPVCVYGVNALLDQVTQAEGERDAAEAELFSSNRNTLIDADSRLEETLLELKRSVDGLSETIQDFEVNAVEINTEQDTRLDYHDKELFELGELVRVVRDDPFTGTEGAEHTRRLDRIEFVLERHGISIKPAE